MKTKIFIRPLYSVVLALSFLLLPTANAQTRPQDQTQSTLIQSEKQAFRVATLTRGLENPWSIAFLPDGRMLVTERAGRMRILDKHFNLEPKPIDGLPDIIARGQGGLFDVVLHPDYQKNGWIYWAYNAPGKGGWGTALARGKLQGHRMTDVQVIFSMEPKTRNGQHFGGRIVFDNAGMVYLTLGDRGEKDRAQDLNDHAGSVIRLHDDGRVPADNPFTGRSDAKAEKWTIGNRNIQGAAIHPQTGALWTHEHGPQGGDEVNVMRSGRNYGWPVITYGVNYGLGTKIGEGQTKTGMEQPLHVWVPSIAPSGMVFVQGQAFANWKGNVLIGGRIRDVRIGPDGLIYLLTDASEGALLRLEPAKLHSTF